MMYWMNELLKEGVDKNKKEDILSLPLVLKRKRKERKKKNDGKKEKKGE